MIPELNITLETAAEVQPSEEPSAKYFSLSIQKVHSVSGYLGLVVPLLVSIYYAWSRKQRRLIQRIRKHLALTVYVDPLLRAINLSEVLRLVSLVERLVRIAKQIQDTAPSPASINDDDCQSSTAVGPLEEPNVKCDVLYDPGNIDREVDIIFIHGIKGALDKTWTQGLWELASLKVWNLKEEKALEIQSPSSNEKSIINEKKICWPRDWLPQDVPNARIISVSYTTDPYLWRPFFLHNAQRSGLEERAWEMINSLSDLDVGSRSIIWVGHSKGGLYVKQMLVNACESTDSRFQDFSRNTKAIMFYSVPHRGSILANLNFPLLFRQSIELAEVKKNCDQVIGLHKKFLEKLEKKELSVMVRSFIETRLTLMGLFYLRIVSEESADAEVGELYGIPLDHRNICKPKNRDCFLYQQLVNLVRENVRAEVIN